jgi:hypothetical protein
MNWFIHYVFGSRAVARLVLGVVILLALALCTVIVKFVSLLLTHERDADKSDNDYWRIH